MRDYANSWQATLHLVRSGFSWSGSERNCVYLNTFQSSGQSRQAASFANVSAVSGFDFADDGRAIAVVDWDNDGDLDIWCRNRSAPRLRLLLNQTAQSSTTPTALSLKLVGVDCSTQAIGARAELFLKNGDNGPRYVRSIRAGDGFLSQSSTDLHFAVPRGTTAERIAIRWPSGVVDTIHGLKPGQYEIVENSGAAVPIGSRASVKMTEGAIEPRDSTVAGRVVLPGRIPVPGIELKKLNHGDEDFPAEASDTAQLFVFWSSTCPNCRQELTELANLKKQFDDAGLSIIAICLDGLESAGEPANSTQAAMDFVREIDLPFPVKTTDKKSLDLLAGFQRALFDTHPAFAIPLSLLVDENGQLAVIYRGAFSGETYLRDQAILELDDKALRQLSAPLGGRWITEPASRSQFSLFMAERLVDSHPESALKYFDQAAAIEPSENGKEAIGSRAAELQAELQRPGNDK